MTIIFKDIARMYSTTTGDSDIYLNNGAVPGCKTFSEAGIADSDDINFAVVTYNTSSHRPYATQIGTGHVLVDSDNIYRIQRTTTISSINSSDSAETDTNITLSGLSEVYIPWLTKDILRVKEVDGSPNVFPVNTIVVTNGTLTADSVEGQVTITTGGGGGGSSLSLEWYYANSVTGIANNSTVDLLQSGVTKYESFGDALCHWDSDTGDLVFDTAGYYEISYNIFIQASTGNLGTGYVFLSGAYDNYYFPTVAVPQLSMNLTEYYKAAINDIIPVSVQNKTTVTCIMTASSVVITYLHA